MFCRMWGSNPLPSAYGRTRIRSSYRTRLALNKAHLVCKIHKWYFWLLRGLPHPHMLYKGKRSLNRGTIGPVSLTWVLRICWIGTNLEILEHSMLYKLSPIQKHKETIWPCHNNGHGQPRIIIWKKLQGMCLQLLGTSSGSILKPLLYHPHTKYGVYCFPVVRPFVRPPVTVSFPLRILGKLSWILTKFCICTDGCILSLFFRREVMLTFHHLVQKLYIQNSPNLSHFKRPS